MCSIGNGGHARIMLIILGSIVNMIGTISQEEENLYLDRGSRYSYVHQKTCWKWLQPRSAFASHLCTSQVFNTLS